MNFLVGLAAGTLFGVGLVVAQMTDPNRVLGFLDVLGRWDPRLAFVMLGAIAVHAPFVFWLRRRGKPLMANSLHIPSETRIDGRLVFGAALFGVGWGLAGYCPGPAIVAAATNRSALWVVVSMILGMRCGRLMLAFLEQWPARARHPDATGVSDNRLLCIRSSASNNVSR